MTLGVRLKPDQLPWPRPGGIYFANTVFSRQSDGRKPYNRHKSKPNGRMETDTIPNTSRSQSLIVPVCENIVKELVFNGFDKVVLLHTP